jgi:hypothetical protein
LPDGFDLTTLLRQVDYQGSQQNFIKKAARSHRVFRLVQAKVGDCFAAANPASRLTSVVLDSTNLK